MFIRVKPSGSRQYLQIVKNTWDNGKVKQKVIATLGRVDRLKESGELDSLIRSGMRFSEKLAIIDSYEKGQIPSTEDLRIGVPMVFERIWQETGIQSVIEGLLGDRRYQFPEERICQKNRDLFGDLPLVFFDTTSIYFEGNRGEEIGAYGHSKDHRPDLKQMVVGIIIDGHGRPICCELWPGSTADVQTLLAVVARLRSRFGIQRVCIVADRGMISKETIKEIEATKGLQYILGVRMRRQKEVREEVIGRAGRYEEVYPKSTNSKAPSPLKVKEVTASGKRYIICLNGDQAKKDAIDRDAIIAALRDRLKRGEKTLVGNKGYRKYLKLSGTRFRIDEEKIKAETRFDGKWVLTTHTALSSRDVALQYKQLWMVEQIFRSLKTILSTRPIYHKCDETIRGHVFCSFLSLLLIKELQGRIEQRGWEVEWADLMNDLEELKQIRIQTGNKEGFLRSELKGAAGKALQVAGVAIPPTVKIITSEEKEAVKR